MLLSCVNVLVWAGPLSLPPPAQVNSKLDELAPAQPAPAAAAEPAAEGGEQMETDQAAAACGEGAAAEQASPFAKRLALFKVGWGGGAVGLGWIGSSGLRRVCAQQPRPGQLEPPSACSFPPILTCSTFPYFPACPACLPACLQSVMSGDVPIELERQFLARHNHADLQVLKNIRATVEPRNRWAWVLSCWWRAGGAVPAAADACRCVQIEELQTHVERRGHGWGEGQCRMTGWGFWAVAHCPRWAGRPPFWPPPPPPPSCCSVCHSATVFANSLMHCGTTVDGFLRENLDWLKKATNWAKFAATAGV